MRRFGIMTIAIGVSIAAACSSGGSDTTGENPTPSLTVTPSEWSVPAGGAAKQFTATLTGSSDPIVWSVETAGTAAEVGSVSSTGLYTPPPSLATGRDVVVKATAGTLVARATVHVGAGAGGVTLVVTPAAGAVVAGSADTVALLADTNYAGTVSWTLSPTLGTLDATTGTNVVYSAPQGLVTADTDVTVTATAGTLADASVITVHPTVLEVTGPATVHAGGAAVEFVLTNDPGGNAVAWSVEPASVGSIAGTGTVGTLTPASSVGAATPFQVIATIGGATGSASATLLPSLGAASVAGRVVDLEGVAYAGATVVIGAQSTTSAADGTFGFSSVALPYDVTVISEGKTRVDVFREVTKTAPQLEVVRFLPGRSATVSGKVTSGGGPATGALVFDNALSTSATADLNGDYSILSTWTGDAAELAYRALLVGYGTHNRPAAYELGARAVAVTDGATVTGQDIAVSAIGAGHVTGSTLIGADQDLMSSLLAMVAHFDDGAVCTVWDEVFSFSAPEPIGTGGSFDLLVPTLPNGKVRLSFGAPGAAGGRARASAPVSAGQTGVALELPALPTSLEPPDAAVGVGHGTAFTWTSTNTGGMEGLYVSCTGGLTYVISGGPRSATIPDLSAYGVTLAAGTSCTWNARWRSTPIDEHVLGTAWVDALPLVRSANGASRTFTF